MSARLAVATVALAVIAAGLIATVARALGT
jgi:hypothetical protein